MNIEKRETEKEQFQKIEHLQNRQCDRYTHAHAHREINKIQNFFFFCSSEKNSISMMLSTKKNSEKQECIDLPINYEEI